MELQDVIMQRRSVRKFLFQSVPPELEKQILNVATKGPSAGGIRGYSVTPTHLPLTKYNAPLHLVFSTTTRKYAKRYGERGKTLYAVQDATIAAAYAQLAAVDLGLASVWVGAFREGKVARVLGLDDGERPVAILAVGYEAK